MIQVDNVGNNNSWTTPGIIIPCKRKRELHIWIQEIVKTLP